MKVPPPQACLKICQVLRMSQRPTFLWLAPVNYYLKNKSTRNLITQSGYFPSHKGYDSWRTFAKLLAQRCTNNYEKGMVCFYVARLKQRTARQKRLRNLRTIHLGSNTFTRPKSTTTKVSLVKLLNATMTGSVAEEPQSQKWSRESRWLYWILKGLQPKVCHYHVIN